MLESELQQCKAGNDSLLAQMLNFRMGCIYLSWHSHVFILVIVHNPVSLFHKKILRLIKQEAASAEFMDTRARLITAQAAWGWKLMHVMTLLRAVAVVTGQATETH